MANRVHQYQPYANPEGHPGCVRCSYPRDHAIHLQVETPAFTILTPNESMVMVQHSLAHLTFPG